MKYTYIHSADGPYLICCETHELVRIEFPNAAEIFTIPNIVKDREKEAIEQYETMKGEQK